MGNWCNVTLGWNYLKLHGEKGSTNSPPLRGIHQEEIDRSNLWATAIVKARIVTIWDTTGWDWPATPPAVEEVCSLFAAGRLRTIMFLTDFPSQNEEMSTGVHKLNAMAKSQLKFLLSQSTLIGASGEEIRKRPGMSVPVVSSASFKNLYTMEEIEGFRQADSIFYKLNVSENWNGYMVPL